MTFYPRPLTRTFAVLGAIVLGACSHKEEAKPAAPEVRFGLSLDTLRLKDTVVASGATLGSLLASHGLTPPETHRLVQASEGVYDVRKIRAGQPLHLAYDTLGRLRHLVYEPDPVQWVRFDLDSVPRVQCEVRQVDTIPRTAGGTIESSLWINLTAQGHSPALIARVADILAWQVDFFTVQPGDTYQILYDELVVEGNPVGLGDIQAVSFTQSGATSHAYLYRDSLRNGYYDAEGHPAKRMFLKAPLQYSRISSRFSNSRMHPVLRIARPHHGVDYAAPSGTPVMTVGDGSVLARGWDPKGGGNYVKIRHNGTFSTTYMHLKAIAGTVRVGKRVSQGDLIGWVGSTGLATGPHLDFRFFRDGRPVNPLTVMPPPAPPLDAAVLPSFLAHVDSISGRLGGVATDFRPQPKGEDPI